MQPRLFIALPIILAVSACSEEIQAQDQPPARPDEIRAIEGTEVPNPESETATLDIKLRDPVELD